MKASVLISALGLTGLAVGLGQWSAAVAGSDGAHVNRTTLAGTVAGNDLRARNADSATPRVEDVESSSEPISSGMSSGADIQYSDIYQVTKYGPVSNTYAYSLGSRTCNLGDEYLIWQNFGSPGFASNAYRLHEGRLMQIGTGWVKHACCVANNNSPSTCSGLSCSPPGVPGLRPGCMDVYSASWNAIQDRLGPRVNINPHTGAFAQVNSGSYSAISRRLQIHRDEMTLTNYPGALFFVEGVYVCTSSAEAGNVNNNATHRRVTFNQTNFDMSLAAQQHVSLPAIFAWQKHGLGVDTPDPDVTVKTLDLQDEGRLFAANKVSDNGDGTWRYEYAVYNLNSHQAAGSFSVGIGDGVTISNVGFHSPPYHSGENQDTTPWQHTITANEVTWSTTESHAQNPNANAIRWGSMYNFWFDADQPPVDRQADIGVFAPGPASGVSVTSQGPADGVLPCPADVNDDGEVDGLDLLLLLTDWGPCPGCDSDINGDGEVDGLDLLILLSAWGECP